MGLETLRGLGQIMLQGHALTGFFFLLAMLWLSPAMAMAAVAASFLGTLWAHRWRHAAAERGAGMYGFNAALIALALVLVPRASFLEVCLVVLAAVGAIILAVTLTRLALQRGIPVLTAPFVLIVWILLVPLVDFGLLPSYAAKPDDVAATSIHPLEAVSWSFGQIMFLNHTISGCLVFIGLAVSCWRSALWACAAAMGSAAYAWLSGWPATAVDQGLFGYNAVLTCVALMAVAWPYRMFGILLSCLIMHLFLVAGLPALTAPFVIAAWISLIAWSYSLRRSGGRRPSVR